jgi:hypothetical protein
MLFEEGENRRGLFVGSIIGSFNSFIQRSFKGLFIIKSLVSAQPIKGLFSGVLVRGLTKVLTTLINKGYYRIAGDRVASPMSRMTGSQMNHPLIDSKKIAVGYLFVKPATNRI